MREKLFEFLEREGAGHRADSESLMGVLFGDAPGDTAFGVDFLSGLLADDPRFQHEDGGAVWYLAESSVLDLSAAEAPFIVVDLETTGQSPGLTGITEIGALKLEGNREVGRFDTLVNPGKPIPPYVAKLTGITDDMVADAPSIEDVIVDFFDFAKGGILVAHNAAFDAQLLDQITRRVIGVPLGLPSICTLKLVRSLMPELTKGSLDALSEHFSLHSESRHRAMADVELTAQVLERLVPMVGEPANVSVARLIDAQEHPETSVSVELQLERSALESLPNEPGVYWLVGENGETLYVGRANDLRSDVLDGYLSPTHLSDRQRGMLSKTFDVGFRVARSDLEASLIEAKQMRSRNPEYNRGDRHLPRGFYVKVSPRGPYPRVHATSRIARDGGTYLGPIKGKAFAEDAAELLARLYGLRTCPGPMRPDPEFDPCELGPSGACSSPCNGAVSRAKYGESVKALSTALRGDASVLHQRIDHRVEQGAAKQPRDGAILSRLLKLNRRASWLVNEHSYVAGILAGESGLMVVVVLGGFCHTAKHVADRAALDDLLGGVTEDDFQPKRRLGAFEADASTIMANWVRKRGDDDDTLVVRLNRSDLAEGLAEARQELGALIPPP